MMHPRIHRAAARGFQIAPESYERGRPGYPNEALAFLTAKLPLSRGVTVLDLGAGSGKFAQLLAATGAEVIAVEPVDGMRKKFSELLPDIRLLEGTAEAIPLPNQSVDSVTVATAFHWFNGEESLAEIYRVLKPHGKLALIWNVRDESVPWMARITDIMQPHETGVPRYRSGDWRKAFQQTSHFTPLEHASFRHTQKGPPEIIVDRVASVSFIAALPEAHKAAVLGQVRQLLTSDRALRGLQMVDVPYRTDVFWCSRRNHQPSLVLDHQGPEQPL